MHVFDKRRRNLHSSNLVWGKIDFGHFRQFPIIDFVDYTNPVLDASIIPPMNALHRERVAGTARPSTVILKSPSSISKEKIFLYI